MPHPKIQVELSTELNFFQDGGTPHQKKRLLEGVDTAHTLLMGETIGVGQNHILERVGDTTPHITCC